jgi:hypothetical protein
MSITRTYAGSVNLGIALSVSKSGDVTGKDSAALTAALAFAAAVAPTISGFLSGVFVAAAGDLLLAHATDPLQAMGDAAYSDGFTVAGSKLKFLFIRNNDGTNSVTISRGATNGLPVFDAAGDSVTLGPGDWFLFFKKAGTAALVTGTNDKLTIAVSGGTPSCDIVAVYGP